MIDCFLLLANNNPTPAVIDKLAKSPVVNKIFLVSPKQTNVQKADTILIEKLHSTICIKSIASHIQADYTLICTKPEELSLGAYALERFLQIAQCGAGLVYADYYSKKKEQIEPHPVIDYQEGSLRDDFNFGSVLCYNSNAFKEAAGRMHTNYTHAGLYDLRLKVSQKKSVLRIPEFLYSEVEQDDRLSGQKIFDYVDPKNRNVQIEMEAACTQHLKDVGAYLSPKFTKLSLDEGKFNYEASIIIPVRNREKTIADAIESVIIQKADFAYNLIIVDNHSTDTTTEIIQKYTQKHTNILHIIPERKDLGIGGCWTEAIMHSQCGKFSVQLDSDDVYADENVLQTIVDTFYKENCAMVVGTYLMTNFDMEEIPPGIIDHKEWTPENGRNNALRINGLGAPRAFYTPVLRKIKVPNVSYGEDYALGLAISRHYQIGRIYTSLYFCRRWEDNSDASLSIEKQNQHNSYKDTIRTFELLGRKQLIKFGKNA